MLNCLLHYVTLAAQVKYFCYRKSDSVHRTYSTITAADFHYSSVEL